MSGYWLEEQKEEDVEDIPYVFIPLYRTESIFKDIKTQEELLWKKDYKRALKYLNELCPEVKIFF